MALWWESLTNLQQVLALFAIPATIILALQTLLLLFGLGGHGDADDGAGIEDHDGHDAGYHPGHHGSSAHAQHDSHPDGHHDGGLRIFTVRAFVAFFSIFGWLGIALIDNGVNNALSITLAFLTGATAMVGIAYFFKSVMRLQSSGNIDIRNSLGKTATVYIPIPPNRSGKGKVTVLVQGRLSEVEAVTDSEFTLKTGSEVVGVSVSNQNVLCVAPLQKHAG